MKARVRESKPEKYNPSEIEKKWQKAWSDNKTFSPDLRESKKPYYNLMMFPYPSAEGLHAGNMYAFTGADIWGRYQRMLGHDVFQPIGLDGFGIHSENYAIKVGRHPKEVSAETETRYYAQLRATGIGYDWDHTLETYDTDYYRWTQWLFVQMFKKGLAYRTKAQVNWCPSCKTVLADEQVIAGECERCSSLVEKRDLEQWFFKITDYADRLLGGLDKIDWTEKVKIAQKNWIGKSYGAEIDFEIVGTSERLTAFTTRPDTLYGVTFVAIGSDSKLIDRLVTEKHKQDVSDYLKNEQVVKSEERTGEKRGVFTGSYVINPANEKQLPVYLANYVVSGYGAEAVMGVPAHDQRDSEFANKYGLEIVPVIQPVTGIPASNEEDRKSIVAIVRNPASGKLISINWGEKLGGNLFVGGGREADEDPVEAARREIKEETGYKNLRLIHKTESIEHHYIAHSKNVNRRIEAIGLLFELENEDQDPVSLEENEKDKFKVEWLSERKAEEKVQDPLHKYVFNSLIKSQVYTGAGKLINSGEWDGMFMPEDLEKVITDVENRGWGQKKITYHLRDWLISRQRYWGPPIPMVFCEKCANANKGEREDMPGWFTVPEDNLPVVLPYVENFKPTGTGEAPLAQDAEWMKVDCPECGSQARRETDVSDTFLDSAWYYLRYPSTNDDKAPFDPAITKKWLPVNMYIGGAEHSVLHLMYVRFATMALSDWGYLNFEEPFPRFYAHGLLIKEGKKMSKSKGNIINPDDYIAKYGADTLRSYLMFLAPFNQGGDFRDTGIEGMDRFLKRAWKLVSDAMVKADSEADIDGLKQMHKTIKKVTEEMDNLRYNTSLASLMEYYNFLSKQEKVSLPEAKTFLLLLAPFAPHLTEELWSQMHPGKADSNQWKSVHFEAWPTYDPALIIEDIVEIPIQINGKLRGTIKLALDQAQNQQLVEASAREDESIAKYLAESEPKKVIFIAGKLINFVV
jgi:leucyl-tRNA synthetase